MNSLLPPKTSQQSDRDLLVGQVVTLEPEASFFTRRASHRLMPASFSTLIIKQQSRFTLSKTSTSIYQVTISCFHDLQGSHNLRSSVPCSCARPSCRPSSRVAMAAWPVLVLIFGTMPFSFRVVPDVRQATFTSAFFISA